MSGRCDCYGQCGKHKDRCTALYGQMHLFDRSVDRPIRVGQRFVCEPCALTFDEKRAARELRAMRSAVHEQREARVRSIHSEQL